MGIFMAENKMKEAFDEWEKATEKLIEETRKAGAKTSKDLEKQFKDLEVEGEKMIKSFQTEGNNFTDKTRADLEKRFNMGIDKLKRAWDELMK
jgi:vacuolar-type H+-ATPase subunit H